MWPKLWISPQERDVQGMGAGVGSLYCSTTTGSIIDGFAVLLMH